MPSVYDALLACPCQPTAAIFLVPYLPLTVTFHWVYLLAPSLVFCLILYSFWVELCLPFWVWRFARTWIGPGSYLPGAVSCGGGLFLLPCYVVLYTLWVG
jgi:hypothetical protein